MKKIYVSTGRLLSAMLAGTIAILGFSGCKSQKAKEIDSDGNPKPVIRNDIMLMYGVPAATYRLSGIVTDEKGAPVQGADVTIKEGSEKTGFVETNRMTSGPDGMFGTMRSRIAGETVRVVATPSDSALAADSVDIKASELQKNLDKDIRIKLKKRK